MWTDHGVGSGDTAAAGYCYPRGATEKRGDASTGWTEPREGEPVGESDGRVMQICEMAGTTMRSERAAPLAKSSGVVVVVVVMNIVVVAPLVLALFSSPLEAGTAVVE
ncbi:hypothetical protein ACQY0O_006934 [Thecaphora frezii]